MHPAPLADIANADAFVAQVQSRRGLQYIHNTRVEDED
jgi:hypothetical protein